MIVHHVTIKILCLVFITWKYESNIIFKNNDLGIISEGISKQHMHIMNLFRRKIMHLNDFL